MGSNTSKPNNETTVVTMKNDLDACDNSDPRSPTPEITRTPLQDKSGSTKHSITKNMDLRKTFENGNGNEKLIHNNPILSAVIKNHLQCYDPRSPTQDFERTPIIISSRTDNDNQKINIQHDNCATPVLKTVHEDFSGTEADDRSPDLVVSRNLCERMINASLDDSIKEPDEPLGSSTASNEAIENDISKGVSDKLTTLLETNFDYVESDNDKFEDSEDNVQNLADPNTDEVKHIPIFKLLNEDPRSPSIGIERTPIVVTKIEGKSNECNVESMSDDTLIKVLQNTNAELRQAIVNKPEDGESLLIYEDDTANINETPKKSKSDSISGSRTPLSCMKNKADVGHTRSKSANTLYDPKNQQNALSKIPKRSHIPRLKCLSKQTKLMPSGSSVSLKNISKAAVISGDCENTPPHSHRDRWDKDSSIVL